MGRFEEVAEKKRALVGRMKGVIEESGGYDVLDFTKVATALGDGDAKARHEKWMEMVNELNDLEKEYEAEKAKYDAAHMIKGLDEAMNAPVNRLGPGAIGGNGKMSVTPSGLMVPTKSLGEMFTDSPEFKAFDPSSKGATANVTFDNVDTKTLLTVSGSGAQQTPVATEFVGTPRRRLVVADLMPNVGTNNPIVTFMEMTTDTNNAGVTAEGAAKNESAIAWTKRETRAKKITDSIPVTTETLEDIPGIRSEIDDTLRYHILYAEEVELLNGDGTGEHLLGLTQLPNILTQARGTDNNVDAIFKLMTQIRSTGTGTRFAEPSGGVLHPTNWQTIRLMKTADGQYIWGPPSEEGTDRVWGKTMVVTPAITENTALIGDFRGWARVRRYKQIRIEVGMVNNQFLENERTILAEERIALEVKGQQAFGLATGLN